MGGLYLSGMDDSVTSADAQSFRARAGAAFDRAINLREEHFSRPDHWDGRQAAESALTLNGVAVRHAHAAQQSGDPAQIADADSFHGMYAAALVDAALRLRAASSAAELREDVLALAGEQDATAAEQGQVECLVRSHDQLVHALEAGEDARSDPGRGLLISSLVFALVAQGPASAG